MASPEHDPRNRALDVLDRVERTQAYAAPLIRAADRRLRDPRDSALLRELVLGVLRRRAALDYGLSRVASRPLSRIEPFVRIALRAALYELQHMRVPTFATVHRYVESVKRRNGPAAAGFANGVLRAAQRDPQRLEPPRPARGDVEALACFHSHPEWWVRRAIDRWGWETAEAVLVAHDRPAPTFLHPNTAHPAAGELLDSLARDGIEVRPGRYAASALEVVRGAVHRSAALRDGLCWVQDEAAQLVTALFGTGLTGDALDVCAAPGGKSLQLAQRLDAGGRVVALDRHPARAALIRDNAARTGLTAICPVTADATRRLPLRSRFAAVLVDAPCTGTGTLRRHPEIRWRLRPDDPARMARVQRRILRRAAEFVAPDGVLVYAVCSLEREEGERVVERFLEEHDGFRVEDPRGVLAERVHPLVGPSGFLRTTPVDGGHDGFFAARLARKG